MKKTLAIVLFFALSGFVFAHDQHYDNENSGFREGYAAGYRHGVEDMRARVNYDFTHAAEYREGISYDSRNDCEFRVGYAEGYMDGYFRRNPKFSVNFDYRQNYGNEYGNNSGYGTQPGYNQQPDYRYGSAAAVTVFTEPGFRGSVRQFPVGRYEYLTGGWDDKIESLQTNGAVRVILFDERNFRGDRRVVEGNAVDLGDFRRKAASMIVEPLGSARH
jgi:hypothetical protein